MEDQSAVYRNKPEGTWELGGPAGQTPLTVSFQNEPRLGSGRELGERLGGVTVPKGCPMGGIVACRVVRVSALRLGTIGHSRDLK